MKKVLYLVFSFLIVVIFHQVFISCDTQEYNQHLTDEAQNFMNVYERNYKDIVTTDLTTSSLMRSIHVDGQNDDITLYFDFPEDTPVEVKNLCHMIRTVQDISALHNLTAAEVSTTDDVRNYCVTLSKSKIKEVLSPTVEESKKYLYSKGFTEEDIQEMLEENNADETELVILVLALTNQEYKDMEFAKLNIRHKSLLDIFVTPCYATDLSVPIDCGVEAIGLDVFTGLTQSTAKTWSVKVIKQIFKTVAKKALGPVGALIAVGDFAWCLHRRGFSCVIMGTIPISPIEYEFKKIKDENK